jgi:hypothetical protein
VEGFGVDLYRVVGVLSQAFSIAAGLPMTYRKAHASDLNAASISVHRLTELVKTMEEATNAGAATDWELRRLIRVIRRESRSLRGNLDRAFNRTIRYGPGGVAGLDKQARLIQALLLRAQDRARDLMLGRAAVSTQAECVGVDERWHRGIPVAMVRAAIWLTPVLHQGRYQEELMGELLEQESWADKFDYAFRALVRSGRHRRNLADVVPYKVNATSIRQDDT